MGDRLGYLQHGLDAATAIGDIGVISSVVETPAVGFEGNPFLNACFTIDTQLSFRHTKSHTAASRYGAKTICTATPM